MQKKYTTCFFVGLMWFSVNAFAAENPLYSTWKSLISFSKLSPEIVKKNCPHFNENVQRWITSYPSEVNAFLNLPAIKKLNPSLVDLGLKKEAEEAPRTFGNPFLKWVNGSGITPIEMKTVAPHFPNPKITADVALSEKQYEAVLADWMVIYAIEYEHLINNPKLVKSNKYYTGYQKINSPVADSSWKVLSPSTVQPSREQFDSGNEALDAKRFEQYTRAWYFRYNKIEYFRIYEPSKADKYLKELEMENNDKGVK